MPSPFVLVTPRMMAGATATNTAAVTFEYPVLNITTKFDHVIRASANTTIASLTVNRTVNTELVCSVPWTVTGTGVNPATAAYFSGSVFPSGTLSFSVGETSKTIQITISAGTAPAQELTATFKLDTPTGAVLGANTHFLFAITAPLSFPARVDPSEPGWVNIPSYATTPNPVTFATAADFTTASDSAAPNQSLILTTNLDAEGATFTLDALGTTAQPVFLRGNSDKKASFPELKNATLIVNGSRWVICNLRLNNVRILVRDGSYTQIQQNRFTNFTDGGAGKGAVVFESNSTARYTRIYGNDFIGDSVNPFKRAAVYGSALTEEINYKYLWIEKNLFKGFSDDGTTTNSAIAIGPNDGDATFDCHTYIRSNLFKDYAGTGYVIDTGCAGIACFDNTFETTRNWVRIRQGCTKPDQNTGNIVDGNLWVAPLSTSAPTNKLLNPFSAASHHHMPIGTGAAYAGTSDAAYVDLQRAAGFVSLNSNNGYGKNVFQATGSDPLKTIAWNGDENGYGLGGTGPANPGNIRFPSNALITNLNAAAVDRGIAIMAPDGYTVYELRGYNNNPTTPQASGLKIYDARGLGYDTGTDRWGFSASGVGNLFGLLRAHEMNDPVNVVSHVLQLALAYNASTAWTQDHGGPILQGDFIAPANGTDSRCNTDATSCTGSVKYGSRWAIPPVSAGGPDLTTLALTAREMQLAVCLRDFGTMVIDGTDSAAMRCDQGWNSGVIVAVRDAMRKLWPRLRRITNSTTTTGRVIGGGTSIGGVNTGWDASPPSADELSTSTVFVTAASYSELVSRLDAAAPGTCITLTNNAVGAYAGANLTKTLSGTSTKPIVIRGPVSGPDCGVQSACPKIPFDLVIDGSYVYFYGIDFNRGNSSLTNSTTLRLATTSSNITIRRCWFFRKFGNLVRINGTRHTVDFCDFSIWGTQEYPTTDGLTPAPNSTKANWLPTGPFQCMYDGGSTATYMTLRRNYLHDCPFKMPDNYSWHVVTGFSNGDNPSEALENAYWLVKENLVWKAGHMDIATKTSHNTIQGNTIDGSGNKTNFNQRAGNYNDYLSNWYETGTYSPQFSGHGGYNKWIGNRLPSGKKFVTQCGDHVWTYTYTSSDPSDREHNSHQALYWGNIGDIEDGYRDDNAKTVVPTETQIVPSAGQNYTNTRATSPNTSATAPVGYSLVAAVKLTASDVGPGSAWIAP